MRRAGAGAAKNATPLALGACGLYVGPMTRPLILASNDDGVHADGLTALAAALREIADVIVVAPMTQQSAKSHAITLHHPLRHQRHPQGVHAVDGTPADCVYVALFREGLLPRRPDMVVSGINHGANLGGDVYYSGTVAAAREAALRGIPSIAFSALHGASFKKCAAIARDITLRVLGATAPDDQAPLLNVNFPSGEVKGVRATRLGDRQYSEGVIVRDDPHGREYYWIGGPGGITHTPAEGTDTTVTDAGYVSITPLDLRATRSEHLGLAAYVAEAPQQSKESKESKES